MVPGVGVTVNGATRWLGAGPLQFQPSELLKLALILYAVRLLAAQARHGAALRGPGAAAADGRGRGVRAAAEAARHGHRARHLLRDGSASDRRGHAASPPRRARRHRLAGLALLLTIIEPYRMARLTAFLDPSPIRRTRGFQTVQALTAIGSGGLLGVGLGESVQKIFYLPEAHTDMILAIIGEEFGLVGILGVAALYGMIGYAGPAHRARPARTATPSCWPLGITSLILCQATLNYFAVLGMAPLTGVPLPFISYGATNLVVLLAGMGLLLGVAPGQERPGGAGATRGCRAIEGGRHATGGDRGGRDGGARGAGARRRGRATG